MQINQKKSFFIAAFLFVMSAVVVGLIVVFLMVKNTNVQVADNNNIPLNEFPLIETDNAPKNYSFVCNVKEVVVSAVQIKHLLGKLFALCSYSNGNTMDDIAVLLGYVDEGQNSTFMFGNQFGVTNRIFQTDAFQNLATQAGFVSGSKLGVVITAIGHPSEGQGVKREEVLGNDIDKIYEDKESFNLFAQTGLSSNLPKVGEVKKVPVVLPVSVQVIR